MLFFNDFYYVLHIFFSISEKPNKYQKGNFPFLKVEYRLQIPCNYS